MFLISGGSDLDGLLFVPRIQWLKMLCHDDNFASITPVPYDGIKILLKNGSFKQKKTQPSWVCLKTIDPCKFPSGTLELYVYWWNIPLNLSQSYAENWTLSFWCTVLGTKPENDQSI